MQIDSGWFEKLRKVISGVHVGMGWEKRQDTAKIRGKTMNRFS